MSSKFSTDNIRIASLKVYYDKNTATKTRETVNMLHYESQHFRCKVQLEFTDSYAEENWSVGLVQACDQMYLENRYGNSGSSFWEFHPLQSKRHKMVNDSDGRQYPFYSLTSSRCEVRCGVVRDTMVTLQYEDHFYPTVAWELPCCYGARLTDVIRKQDFWVWLVAIQRGGYARENFYNQFNAHEDKVFVLKTMRWRYNLHLKFDPYQQVGFRLKEVLDTQAEQPYVLNQIRPIPLSALCPPHCNAAQSLIWYPANRLEPPKVLIPPKQVIVGWDTWCSDMMRNCPSRIPRPKDCQLVGEWENDEEFGQPGKPAYSAAIAGVGNHSRQHSKTR